jgi:TetR/AcrR family transcriptional regulator
MIRRPAKRSSGRPSALTDPTAREALLDAAVRLFAERGVAATSSVGIAREAGLTPAMIHYYFRSREQLLDAVVSERLARFVAHVFDAPMPGPEATTMVVTVVRRLFEAAEMMPWMPPIWIREIVSEGGALRERMLQHFPVAAVTMLMERIAQEQREGNIPAGIEPRLAFLSIAGATMLPLSVRSLWSRMPGLATLTDAQLERHALTLLTAGLAPAIPRRRQSS